MADSETVRGRWNERHEKEPEGFREPDEFFVRACDEFAAPAFPKGGDALDVAGGPGRHALYLAARGWRTTLVDISDVAIRQAQARAAERGLTLTAIAGECSAFDFGRQRFDLITVFYYLERELFPALFGALRSGGLLIYKTYTVEQLAFGGGPADRAHLLQTNELLWAFAQMDILHYHESAGERATAELVARRK